MGSDRVKVALWDCSGNLQYQPLWSALCKVLAAVTTFTVAAATSDADPAIAAAAAAASADC
jgi:L-alanine-DL-glutamate epimerase-like enolase superfamily enzyme